MSPAPEFKQVCRQRAIAALRNLFVADALAMPVHWYYNVHDIEKAFPGGVHRLEAAPDFHPSSIMSLHSTTGGGRRAAGKSDACEEIVGSVILKGRRKYWGRANIHYHQGMRAGDNTLNAHCSRVLMRCLVEQGGHYDRNAYLAAYIAFMTADPPQHNDTYAESCHRGFFANLQQGFPPSRCAAVTHDTPSVGGLVTLAPLVLALRLNGVDLQLVRVHAQSHLALTHPDALLGRIADDYVGLIDRLLFTDAGASVEQILVEVAKTSIGLDLASLLRRQRDDREVLGRQFSTACYIDGAWPGILYLLCKYWDQPDKALLVNTNLGGDNVHRGAVLGVLLGLIHGRTAEPSWYAGLLAHDAIEQEIAALIDSCS